MADEDNGFGDWGGYMEAKKAKLMEQYSKERKAQQKDSLFEGISVFVNGRTDPPANEIKRIMMDHGGVYHHYERTDTKFVIASNLCDVKVRNTSTAKIIAPSWITDCLNAKKLVDYTNYLLYTDRDSKQPKIKNFALVSEKRQKEKTCDKDVSKAAGTSQMFKNLTELSKSLNSTETSAQSNNDSHNSLKYMPNISSDEQIFMESDEINANGLTEDIFDNSDEDTLCDETKDETVNLSTKKPLNGNSLLANKTINSNAARTAVDPLFMNEFFNNSRLHHIATLGASFKQYISDLREKNKSQAFPQRKILQEKLLAEGVERLNEKITSCIMHIDMDCFFVSVGLRDRPELKDKPVAVTHSKGGAQATDVPVHPNANRALEKELFVKKFEQQLHNNVNADKVKGGFENKLSLSEIASCSYAARDKGIKNGMFVGEALKLCPDLITIPYDFDGYKDVATTLFNTVIEYTLNIEAVSCDEMFVDLTDIINDIQIPVMIFVESLRKIIFERTRCTCSAGLGANKFQARMATKRAKPNGQYYLKEGELLSFIETMPIKELPGVGYSTNHTLKANGLIVCGDLLRIPKARLQNLIGQKLGEKLYNFCQGKDPRPMEYDHIRKSVSAEVNYGIRFKTQTEVDNFLKQLATEVHRRLVEVNRSTKSIVLKVMVRAKDAPVETSKYMGHGICDNLTKTTKLNKLSQSLDTISLNVITMMKSLNIPPNELRGIGITLTNLDKPETQSNENQTKNHIKKLFAKIIEKKANNQIEEQPATGATMEATAGLPLPLPSAPTTTFTCTSTTMSTRGSDFTTETNREVGGALNLEQDSAFTRKDKDLMKRKKSEGISSIYSYNNTTNKETKKTSTIFTMFNAVAEKIEKQKDCANHAHNLPSDIDPEVFAALPDDIKKEILYSYQNNDNDYQMSSNQGMYSPRNELSSNLFNLNNPDRLYNGRTSRTCTITRPTTSSSIYTSTATTTYATNPINNYNTMFGAAVDLSTKPLLKYSSYTDLDDQPSTSKAAAERRLLNDMKSLYDNEVDQTFLMALPESIRKEIVSDYKSHQNNFYEHPCKTKIISSINNSSSNYNSNTSNNINNYYGNSYKDAAGMKQDSNGYVKDPANYKGGGVGVGVGGGGYGVGGGMRMVFQSKKIDANAITLDGLTCWIEDCDEPDLLDVKIFSDYCYYLIDINNLSELFDKLIHICRVIMECREESCTWHTVFRVLYNLIQDYMLKVNEKRLFFNLDINCDKCNSLPLKETSLYIRLISSTN